MNQTAVILGPQAPQLPVSHRDPFKRLTVEGCYHIAATNTVKVEWSLMPDFDGVFGERREIGAETEEFGGDGEQPGGRDVAIDIARQGEHGPGLGSVGGHVRGITGQNALQANLAGGTGLRVHKHDGQRLRHRLGMLRR